MIRKILCCFIAAYQRIGPFFFIHTCRFHPTCSHYMSQAIQQKGAVKGIIMGIKRICRCHPFTQPQHDPVR